MLLEEEEQEGGEGDSNKNESIMKAINVTRS